MKSILVWSQSWASTDDKRSFVLALEEQIGIVGFKEPVEISNICICYVSVMSWIQRNGSFFNITFVTWMIRYVVSIVKDFWGLIRCKWARAVAKTWKFIHIEPDSRKLNLLIQGIKHINPILGRIRMKEINEGRGSRPNCSDKIFSCWGFDIHIPL